VTVGEAKEPGRVPSGPVLFASMGQPARINPLLAIVGELSRRGVRDLWFVSDDDVREQVEQCGGQCGELRLLG
jgi:UDP:flavonoid glycosyltransferase YjiC (YdhE family)